LLSGLHTEGSLLNLRPKDNQLKEGFSPSFPFQSALGHGAGAKVKREIEGKRRMRFFLN